MSSSSRNLVNIAYFSWYPWKTNNVCFFLFLLLLISCMIFLYCVHFQQIPNRDVTALTVLEVQNHIFVMISISNVWGFCSQSGVKRKRVWHDCYFTDVNILPMDCTDVFSPSITLQNHKTTTSHFTNFIVRNILSFDFPLYQHNIQVDNLNLQFHKHFVITVI